MSAYNQSHNANDVFLRTVIIGLLNFLNGKLTFTNLRDGEVETVTIPFFFGQGSQERFLQDFYTQWFHCAPEIAEGSYGGLPKGSVMISSFGIDPSRLGNRYVEAEREVIENGQIKHYRALVNWIPIVMSFTVQVKVAQFLESTKVADAILRTFWKAGIFRMQFDGFTIGCQTGFGDDIDVVTGKQVEYVSLDDTGVTMQFTIDLETYFPAVDESSQTFAGNRIESFVTNTDVLPIDSADDEGGNDGDADDGDDDEEDDDDFAGSTWIEPPPEP